MSVNGITGTKAVEYAAYDKSSVKNQPEKEKVSGDTAAVYKSSVSKMSDAERSELVKKLKQDAEARVAQMQSLVTDMFKKQGIAIGTADDMWKVLASGEFSADPATIAQAKEDISEDGYWGVEQTSQRIFDFAMALSGGDEEQMKKMQDAFEKGFAKATGTWGRELPEISSKTYDAVTSKFEEFYKGNEAE